MTPVSPSSALPQDSDQQTPATETPADQARSAASRSSAGKQAKPPTPFHDLDHVIALPRLSGLAISGDGGRLVTTVATLDAAKTAYRSAIWELDPLGERPARRITRSAKGEAGAAFSSSGELYFTSSRPDPDAAAPQDEPKAALWVIPAEGGEARLVAAREGGIGGLYTAKDADVLVVQAQLLPGATDEKSDAALRKLRKESKVAAILHSGYPIRYWDADLGPGEPHLLLVADGDIGESAAAEAEGTDRDLAGPADPGGLDAKDADDAQQTDAALPSTIDARPPAVLRDLTPGIGSALREAEVSIAPDGTFALVTLRKALPGADISSDLARIALPGGERSIVLQGEDDEYLPGPISPDGARAVVTLQRRSTPEQAVQVRLGLLDIGSGELTPLAPDWDRWSMPVAWFPDGKSVLVIADSDGRAPLFRVHCDTGEVTQLTDDDAAYSAAVIHPDGRAIFGVRSSYEYPSEVVRIDVGADGTAAAPIRLPNPVDRPLLPGWLEEIETTADDGTRIRGWLALPEDCSPESPAPLALWIHGGPLSSWNAWSWRWIPWILVAQGYAVLLPDPALSTGYGQEFIQRGWGRWGAEPFTDLMSITDAAVARDDIDDTKTVAMGGSFGGYMANWVAGHTDRFAAIVTHASLWALDQFGPTTDMSCYWAKEMSPEMEREFSPHRFVDKIVTPMLVIHGDKDYRVPIGEGLRLWYELLAHSGRPAGADGATDHRFLYFPNENHWILTPQHAKVWYQVVLGFLAEHLHGTAPELPPALGLVAPTDD